MAIYQYQEISSQDLMQLSRIQTAVLMHVGPMESHGQHLPLGTDPLMSAKFCDHIAQRLQEKMNQWNFLIFPPIIAGCDTLINPGGIEIKQSTFKAYLNDCILHLVKDGFKNIIIISAHGGPRHLVVIEELSEKFRWRHKARVISATSNLLLDIIGGDFRNKIITRLEEIGCSLNDEEKKSLKNDIHGGIMETSMMLYLHPHLVKPIYKTLKPILIDRLWKMNRKSGKTIGAGLGYLGSPEFSKPEIGKAILDVSFEVLIPKIEKHLNGENNHKDFKSKLYYIPFLRTEFKWILLLAIYAGIFALLWGLMIRGMTEVIGK